MVCPIPRNGRLGFVGDYTGASLTRYSRIRNWFLDSTANPELRVYSGTRYGTQRIPGFIDTVGGFEGFGAIPPLFVGDSFTFFGYTAPTNGVPCTEGFAYHCPAIVNNLTINWNWTAENRGVNWTIGFAANGPVTEITDFDDPCDDSVFCDANPCNLEVVIKNPCAADAVVEFCNIISATLTFTSALDSFSNNSTGCQILRTAGTLDWTLDIVDQNPFIILDEQADYWISIEATTTSNWSLKWGQFLGATNFRINTETGEMISKSNNFGMQAVNCCVPGTPVRGEITNPAGTVVWPYATPV